MNTLNWLILFVKEIVISYFIIGIQISDSKFVFIVSGFHLIYTLSSNKLLNPPYFIYNEYNLQGHFPTINMISMNKC